METVKAGPLPENMVAAFDEAWKITKGDSPEYFTLYRGKGSVGGEKK
jgi:aflatoxin B1 aldehyde reductase